MPGMSSANGHPPPSKDLVVIVDDDPRVLSALSRLLREEPYEVLTTREPQQALVWTQTRDVSLIVCDYQMPDMDGIDLLLAVQECSPTTERLMLTAHPGHPSVLDGVNQGFMTLAAKPWNDRELKEAIRDHVVQHRRTERHIQNVAELERRRLGQDFHDTLGQDLVGLVLLCKNLETTLRSRAAEEAADMAKIVEIAQKSLSAARTLARGLNPPDLIGSALPASLRQMVASVRDTFKVDCRIDWDHRVEFHESLAATQVYWIIHEALTNAVRHANADAIRVEARRTGEGSRVRIVDNGRGLPESLDELSGIGLRIMKSRARRIHATLKIEPLPEGGTHVVCDIPSISSKPVES